MKENKKCAIISVMMKRILFILAIILSLQPVYSVEQEYMPDGYVRDDVIAPYYKKLTNEYFQKVDSHKIDCSWKTYRQEVETPLGKITDELFKNSRRGLNYSD